MGYSGTRPSPSCITNPCPIPSGARAATNQGDDPYFVEQMHQWFIDNHVIYASFWDSNSVYQGQLSNNQYPLAAARNIRNFLAPEAYFVSSTS